MLIFIYPNDICLLEILGDVNYGGNLNNDDQEYCKEYKALNMVKVGRKNSAQLFFDYPVNAYFYFKIDSPF